MDILLSHGYFIAEDEHEKQIMKPYPTLGLLYLSSHLKAKGFAVDLWDSTFRTLEQFRAHVQHTRPFLVGLYCNLMTKQNILTMMRFCQEQGAKVILGGPEPVSYAEEYLNAGADVIVVGEGELTLEELIPRITQEGVHQLYGVNGAIFRNEAGQTIRNLPREQIKDLSAQPWPDREAIDMPRYLDTWKTHHGLSSVSLITARGCPYTCTWCSHSVFGHTHRRRSVADAANEVEWIVQTYQPDQLWYADDVLTIHPRWFLEFAAELKRRSLRVPFECISRADRLNDQVIEALAEMGCYRLWIGSESGSQRILDAMKRKADVTDVQFKTKMLQQKGIEVGMFIMLGYEGEAVSDIEATVDHLKKSNPDVFLTTVAYPIKDTAFYNEISERVTTHLAWEQRTDRDLQVAGRYSRRFYDHATRWMVNEVNLNRARRAGSRNYWQMAKMYMNAKRGRIGMALTQKEKETVPAGQGWPTQDRTKEAW